MPNNRRANLKREIERARSNLGTAFTHVQRVHSLYEDRAVEIVDKYNGEITDGLDDNEVGIIRRFQGLKTALDSFAVADSLLLALLKEL